MIVGDRFYGRGEADSKTAIALFIYLAKALRDLFQFNGSLFLGFDAHEESGNFSGIREILHQAPKADVCILDYQSFDEIAVGALGRLRLNAIHRTAKHFAVDYLALQFQSSQ